jgi:hypothetical protein
LDLPSFNGLEGSNREPPSREPWGEAGLSSAQSEVEATPFVLSEASPVIPKKIVGRILKGEFVDMSELLKDNMEADRRKRATDGAAPHPPFGNGPTSRDVPDVMSWAQCFSHFAAIITQKYPRKAKELWAYQSTIIGEARRCGGKGWLLYDRAFRQQIPSIEEADFGRLNQALYATTFLAYGGGAKACCPHCMLPDHTREECALNPNRALPLVRMKEAPQQKRAEPGELRREKKKRGPCYAWNDARCYNGPYCRFEHVCSRCGREDHKKGSCREREQQPVGRAGGPRQPFNPNPPPLNT